MPSFKDQTGAVVLPTLDAEGNIPVSGENSTLTAAILLLYQEIRLLRLGLCAAPDSVCVDLEGELTPVTTSEE